MRIFNNHWCAIFVVKVGQRFGERERMDYPVYLPSAPPSLGLLDPLYFPIQGVTQGEPVVSFIKLTSRLDTLYMPAAVGSV